MSEITLVYIAFGKLLVLAFEGFVYSRAGRGWKIPWMIIDDKIRRRVYLPIIYGLAMLASMLIMKQFTWLLLGIVIATGGAYFGTFSIGYGASSLLRKWFGRIGQQFIVGFLQGGSCVLIAWYTKSWGLYILSCLAPCLTLGMLGGCFDTEVNASYKEALVGTSIFLFPLFMI
jgi:hypothetical protein